MMRRLAVLSGLLLSVVMLLALVAGCQEQPASPPAALASPTATPASPAATPLPTATAPPPVVPKLRATTPPPAITTPAPKPTALPPSPTPKPAAFEVISLEVSPSEVVSRQPVTVAVEVRNTGETDGVYDAKLTLDGKPVASKEVKVAAGTGEKVTFSPPLDVAGVHRLEVGGVTRDIKVLKNAELNGKSIKITPTLVFPGQAVTIEAEVTNTGDVKGSAPAVLNVNGVDTDSQPVSLDPGATGKVSLIMNRDNPGSYIINVAGKDSNLTVVDARTYSSAQFGYSFAYPGDWKLDDEESQYVTASKNEALVLVVVNILDTRTRPAEFAKQVAEANAGDRFNLASQSEVLRDGVVYGYQQNFSFTTATRARFTGTQLLIKRGRYGYEVVGIAPDEIWRDTRPMLEAFLASFKPPAVATGLYTDTTHGYSLTLPGGWDAMETGALPTVLKFDSERAKTRGITGFVEISSLGKDMTARDYAAAALESFKSQVPSFKLVAQKEIALGGRLPAYDTSFTFTRGGATVQMRDIALVRGSRAWDIFFMATPADFTTYQNAIDQLVNSFNFVEPRPFGVSRQDSWFVFEDEIMTLDPALSQESPAGIVGAIFSGLVKIGPDLKPTGDLADRWEVSGDGKTYTFHIRDGVKFQNGKQVTAADVKYSWERASDPQTKSRKAATYLGDIVGVPEMLSGKATEISGVKVIDDRTLQVTIDAPRPYFLGKLAQPVAFVVDKANVARGMNWTQTPNGTGPFRLKQWKKDDLLILERNDGYYQPVQAKNVVFRIFAGNPMLMYERGEIDTTFVGLADMDRALDKANPLNKELLSGKVISTGYVGFNVTKPPFDDVNVRKAFALALDMNKILEVSLKGIADRAAGYVPPGIPGHNSDLKPLPFDPVQAKQLLAQSKYRGALPPVTLYVYRGAGPALEAMIAMWKQNLGVEVKVEVIKELKEYYERRYKREFQLFVDGWHADYVDPQNFLEVLFQSQSNENLLAYSNATVDAALKEAAVEPDADKRWQRYQEIEKMVLGDLPAVPFYQSWNSHTLSKAYVKGLKSYPISVNHWNEISIAPH